MLPLPYLMKKTIAVIDLGTNTFHALIARKDDDGTLELLNRKQVPVMLGEGGISENIISQEAYNRGIAALKKIRAVIADNKVTEIYPFATSMLRNAKNAATFKEQADKIIGTPIKIISGEKEAELIYYGVRQSLNGMQKPMLIMDIGGGSIEFIIAASNSLNWSRSYELGAARLIENYHRHDPILPSEIQELYSHLDNQWEEMVKQAKIHNIDTLAGAAGSFETIAAIDFELHLKKSSQNLPGCHEISLQNFEDIYYQIISSTKAELGDLPGMAGFRVNMISVAAVCIKYVIDKLELKHLVFSDYSMKEGILWCVLNNRSDLLIEA